MGENQEKVEQNKVAIMPYDFIDANQPWFYVISPRHYEAFLTKEELLNTPAFKTEELENGVVAIQTWDKPYDVLSKESQEYMLACSTYLVKLVDKEDFYARRIRSFTKFGKPIAEPGD